MLIHSILNTSPFVQKAISIHSTYELLYRLSPRSVQCLVVEDNKADLYSVEGKVVTPFRQTNVPMPRNQARPDHVTMANVRQSGWHQSGVR